MGYAILMFFRKSFTPKSLLLVIVVVDNFVMPIVIPYAVIAIQIQDMVLHWDAPT